MCPLEFELLSLAFQLKDVLFGRGYLIQLHPGNVAFRCLVDERKAEFKHAKKKEKRAIAIQIMQSMRQRNARFLTEDTTACQKTDGLNDIQSRTWLVVEDDKAMKKLMHRLREKEWVSKRSTISSVSAEAVEEETKQDPNESRLDKNDSHRRRITQETVEDERIHLTQSPADADCSKRNEEPLDDISCDPGDLGGNLHRGAHDYFDIAAIFSQEHFGASATSFEKLMLSDNSLGKSCHGVGSNNSSINLQANDRRHLPKNESVTSLCGDSSSSLDFGSVFPNVAPIEQPCSHHFDSEAPENTIQLRQWIKDGVPRGLYTQAELVEYVKTAVTIAIELTEMLAREDEGNPKIVLDCAHISVTMRGMVITRVVVQKSVQLGSVTDRLASLGSIFYELFSGLAPPQEEEAFGSEAGMDELGVSVNRIIGLLQHETRRTKKRPDHNTLGSSSSCGVSNRHHDELMSSLDTIGLTSSLSGLIKNLISCSQSDFRADEAYSSFDDVLTDLNLVIDNPGCYLESLGDSPTFTIPHKLYGRQKTMDQIASLYKCGTCNSLVVNGRAGVGKSSLLANVFTSISEQDGSYFLQTKFEQAGINPLATVASLFDALCENFIRDLQPQVKETVAMELESALGEAGVIALSSIVPSLSKISKSLVNDSTSYQYMNRAATVRYCFGELLQIISSRTPPIIILFDDLQFVSAFY